MPHRHADLVRQLHQGGGRRIFAARIRRARRTKRGSRSGGSDRRSTSSISAMARPGSAVVARSAHAWSGPGTAGRSAAGATAHRLDVVVEDGPHPAIRRRDRVARSPALFGAGDHRDGGIRHHGPAPQVPEEHTVDDDVDGGARTGTAPARGGGGSRVQVQAPRRKPGPDSRSTKCLCPMPPWWGPGPGRSPVISSITTDTHRGEGGEDQQRELEPPPRGASGDRTSAAGGRISGGWSITLVGTSLKSPAREGPVGSSRGTVMAWDGR